jgi:hypothetical protein
VLPDDITPTDEIDLSDTPKIVALTTNRQVRVEGKKCREPWFTDAKVARIVGTHPQYTLDRDWIEPANPRPGDVTWTLLDYSGAPELWEYRRIPTDVRRVIRVGYFLRTADGVCALEAEQALAFADAIQDQDVDDRRLDLAPGDHGTVTIPVQQVESGMKIRRLDPGGDGSVHHVIDWYYQQSHEIWAGHNRHGKAIMAGASSDARCTGARVELIPDLPEQTRNPHGLTLVAVEKIRRGMIVRRVAVSDGGVILPEPGAATMTVLEWAFNTTACAWRGVDLRWEQVELGGAFPGDVAELVDDIGASAHVVPASKEKK